MSADAAQVCRSYTASRCRPNEIGRVPGWTLPWTFTLAQFGIGAAGVAVCVAMLKVGLPVWLMLVPVVATLWLGRAVRRTRIDSRSLLAGLAGRSRAWTQRRRRNRLSPRSADAMAGNAVVGPDHSLWVVLAVTPGHYGLLADAETQRSALVGVERLIESVNARHWRLLSTLEAVPAERIIERMAATSSASTWADEIAAERVRLAEMSLTERRWWLWIDLGDVAVPRGGRGALDRLRRLGGWTPPARASWIDTTAAGAATDAAVARAASAMPLRAATPEEVAALLERVPVGVCAPAAPETEADYAHLGPAPAAGLEMVGRPGRCEGASTWRKGDALWGEPQPRIAVAETPDGDQTAHVTAMVAQLPEAWVMPGGGEVLWRLDALADPWDWVIDVTVVPHAVAQAKTTNQARQLAGQYEQYDGDPAGCPPDLHLAVAQVETQRQALAGGGGDEYVVAVALCSSARLSDYPDDGAGAVLAGRVQRLQGLTRVVGVTVAAPAGDQVAARRLWLPMRAARCPAVRDYRQFLLADGLAGLGPCLQARLGDPQGALLGQRDEHGVITPVLFDPTLGPRASTVGGSPRSPSIGIAGRLGSGKSVFAKRLAWTVLSAGGTVVVVDRSELGEYVAVAEAIAQVAPDLTVEVIDVTDPYSGSLDPMRSALKPKMAADTAVRLLAFAAGLAPRSAVTARVARAAAEMPGAALLDLVAAAAEGAGDPPAWEPLVSLVEVLATDPIGGALFDPQRPPANLAADLVVLHAPGLVLTSEPETPADVAATAVVLGTMLVARALIFADSSQFAALLLDEAWALLPDGRARAVVIEALRDGRKHNAAVWLCTQSPTDFEVAPELSQLLGHVALFGVATEEAAVSAALLAGLDPNLAAPALLELPTGVMLWRDVLGRSGLVDVMMPADRRVAAALETSPATPEPRAA